MWYMCTMEYYAAIKKNEIMPSAAIKKNEIMPSAATWMDLEINYAK